MQRLQNSLAFAGGRAKNEYEGDESRLHTDEIEKQTGFEAEWATVSSPSFSISFFFSPSFHAVIPASFKLVDSLMVDGPHQWTVQTFCLLIATPTL
jgi:hypothetical protein